MSTLPKAVQEAVLVHSTSMEDQIKIRGYDFNKGVDYEALFQSYKTIGFQATNLSKAIEEVNKMVIISYLQLVFIFIFF